MNYKHSNFSNIYMQVVCRVLLMNGCGGEGEAAGFGGMSGKCIILDKFHLITILAHFHHKSLTTSHSAERYVN